MRDVLYILLVFAALLLCVVLFAHVMHCIDSGMNWFTTPLFGNAMSHNAGFVSSVALLKGMPLWNV